MPIPKREHKGEVNTTVVLLFQYFHCLLRCGSRLEQVIVFFINKTLENSLLLSSKIGKQND